MQHIDFIQNPFQRANTKKGFNHAKQHHKPSNQHPDRSHAERMGKLLQGLSATPHFNTPYRADFIIKRFIHLSLSRHCLVVLEQTDDEEWGRVLHGAIPCNSDMGARMGERLNE